MRFQLVRTIASKVNAPSEPTDSQNVVAANLMMVSGANIINATDIVLTKEFVSLRMDNRSAVVNIWTQLGAKKVALISSNSARCFVWANMLNWIKVIMNFAGNVCLQKFAITVFESSWYEKWIQFFLLRCFEKEPVLRKVIRFSTLLDHNVIVPFLATLVAILSVVIGVLSYYVNKLKRRPRIKRRYVVNRTGVTPLTSRPQISGEQCEITIENCCNMNICETVSKICIT